LPLKRISSTSRDYEAIAKALPRSGLYRVKAVLQGIDKKGERFEAESQIVSLAFSAGERSVVSTHDSEHNQHEEHAADTTASGGFKIPLIALAIISVLNALGFLVAQRIVKSKKSAAANLGQRYFPPAQILEALEALENRATLTNVAAEDPIFALLESISDEEEVEAQRVQEVETTTQDAGEPA
jgi:hypothetical protein